MRVNYEPKKYFGFYAMHFPIDSLDQAGPASAKLPLAHVLSPASVALRHEPDGYCAAVQQPRA